MITFRYKKPALIAALILSLAACVDIPSYDPEPPILLRAEVRTAPLIDRIYLIFDREMIAHPPAAPAGFSLNFLSNDIILKDISRPDNERQTLCLTLSSNLYFYGYGAVYYSSTNLIYSQAGGLLHPTTTNVIIATN